VFPTLTAGLACMALTPACLSAAMLQQPAAAKAVPPHDIRVVQRQTTDAEALQMQPPPGMLFIPGGQVFVGTDVAKVSEYGQNDLTQMTDVLAETPRHTATVEAFFIDVTEVTNLQWKIFLDATGRKPSATLVEFAWPDGKIPEGQDNYPVTNLNVPEIREYLAWCGKRLPTEDEWMRAARGDDDRLYPWGAKWDPKLCLSGMTAPQGPVAVGSFPGGASPYGALDMTGNVWEWVDSPFNPFAEFDALPWKQGRKTITLAPEFNSTKKIIKGGSFVATRQFCRIDVRYGQESNSSDASLGFRAARSTQPGLEAVRHGQRRLLPPQFARIGLDEKDMFGTEMEYFDDARKVITDYRYLGFAHRAADRGKSLASIRKESVDEPFPLGVLATSEALVMQDMHEPLSQKLVSIPAGEYTLCYKGPGESKAYKARKKAERENRGKDKDEKEKEPAAEPGGKAKGEKDKGDKAKGGKDEEPAPAEDPVQDPAADDGNGLGAAVPWPGVGSIHDIDQDIDFPQDEEVILFFNASNVVVAWQKAHHVAEADVTAIKSTSAEGGRIWTLEFSVNQLATKNPRFTLPIHLAGEGLP
jgi:formylglycine-generating enzyme required for sulfatase activity